jgi:uncharacterized protein
MEHKHLSRPFAVKAVGDDGTFEGYGSVFGVEDWYRDVVQPGAFAKNLAAWKLKGALPSLCWQHDMAQVIGVYEEMWEDEYGLYLRGRLLKNEVQKAGEAYALLKAKAVTGLSIGYRVVVDEYDRENDIRSLKECELWEISLVTMPANDLARVESVKSIRDVTGLERFLRDAGGVSRREAKEILHHVKSSLRDAGGTDELVDIIQKNINILRG